MQQLELNVLGQMTLMQDGRPSPLMRNAKACALLVYLWRMGEPQSRDALASLLWSETVTQQAKSNLRTLLTRIKRQIDGIETTRQTITFRPIPPPHSDLTTLEDALQSAKTLINADLALWQGDFLYGFVLNDAVTFNEWVSAERERIRQRLLAACQHATTRFANAQQWHAVTAATQRWLRLDPLDETAYHAAIQAALMQDNRSLANQLFEQCATQLDEELGLEPSERLVALLANPNAATRPKHNLPATQATLWGRHDEVAAHSQQLIDGMRLVTLCGLGGVGKTRLALAIGQRVQGHFADGVWFVSLAELDGEGDADTLHTRIAMQISTSMGLAIKLDTPPVQQVLRQLQDQQTLLLLDNFEHLIDGALLVNQLLHRCPNLAIVVTSRERLNLRDEQMILVEGLGVPDNADSASEQFGSVQLFADIAKHHERGFRLDAETLPAVGAICRLVDGVPLGIELTAALVAHYELDEIIDLLTERDYDSFTSRRRDLPARQRSLRAAFDYSWQLLPLATQRIFAALSALRGTFERKAAYAVAGASLSELRRLVDKSLLQQVGKGRYELHPLLQEFSAETLNNFGIHHALSVQERFVAHFLQQLIDQEPHLQSEQLPTARQTLDRQLQNIAQAWRWAIRLGQLDWLRRSRRALLRYFAVRSSPYELQDYLRAAVDLLQALPDEVELLGLFSTDLAHTYAKINRYEAALESAERTLSLPNIHPDAAATAHWVQGEIATRRGQLADGRNYFERALESGGTAHDVAFRLAISMGSNWGLAGDDVAAERGFRQALAIAESADDRFIGMEALRLLGVSLISRSDNSEAVGHLKRSLALHRQLGVAHGEGRTLHGLGTLHDLTYRFEEAIDYYQQGLAVAERLRDDIGIEYILHNMGVTYSRLGAYEQARDCYERRLNWRSTQHSPSRLYALLNLGLLHQHLDEIDAALRLHNEALQKSQTFETRTIESLAWLRLGQDYFHAGEMEKSADCLQRAIAQHDTLKRTVWKWESQAALARTLLRLNRADEALQLVENLLPHLEEHNLYSAREPLLIWWSCYEVLRDSLDQRAATILQNAQARIHTQATKISDPTLKSAFLTQHATNRLTLGARTPRPR